MRTSPSSPSPTPVTRWTASEALIGRVVRHRLVAELDDILSTLWDASFDLIELAEDTIEAGGTVLQANEVAAACAELLKVLGNADELYLVLVALCAAGPSAAR